MTFRGRAEGGGAETGTEFDGRREVETCRVALRAGRFARAARGAA